MVRVIILTDQTSPLSSSRIPNVARTLLIIPESPQPEAFYFTAIARSSYHNNKNMKINMNTNYNA